MAKPSGWIGTTRQFVHAMRTFGAEEDAQGNVMVFGECPSSFMGMGEELIVPEGTKVRIGGQLVGAAALLGATSYGHNVTVIS